MELDFHGVRTPWNRGSTASGAGAGGRAQRPLLSAAPAAQRSARCSAQRPLLSAARAAQRSTRCSASGTLVAMAWRPPVSLDKPRLVREHHGLDAVAKVELLQDVRDVRLDGRVADVELTADLGVRVAARDQAEHVQLTLGQLAD